ncbi:regulatory protein RecX [Insolitispirillum peregrinum]|uniref:regulatory protein RecX n=1 Tax=Insolitispirillum peregrinum TaxID=80876 RepID=UPI0036202D9B
MSDDELLPPERKAAPAPRSGAKPVRKVSKTSLMNAALYHLGRFATSRAGLRQVLERKAWRSLQAHGGDADEVARWIEAVLDSLQKQGWLNDGAFAEARARSLNARGTATRTIRQKLAQKGVAEDDIVAALDRLGEEQGFDDARQSDRMAAVAYARRRRLGPWRGEGELRSERRERDLAALARQGFDLDIARQVIDAETPEQAEDWADSVG